MICFRIPNHSQADDRPVNDSEVVDEVFGFLPEYQKDDMSESQGPSAFRDLPMNKSGRMSQVDKRLAALLTRFFTL